MSNRGSRDGITAAGRWLRQQREQRGIASQAELARRLGWDKTIVNNYETRGVTVPDDRAEQLAEFFGLHIIEARRGLGLWVPPEDRDAPAETEEDALIERLRTNPAARARFFDRLIDERPTAAPAIAEQLKKMSLEEKVRLAEELLAEGELLEQEHQRMSAEHEALIEQVERALGRRSPGQEEDQRKSG